MINIWFAVRNPFKTKPFKMLKVWQLFLSKNKVFEFQISRYTFNFLEFQIDLNWRQTDHAGPWLMINLFGYQFDIRIYDQRNWNDETNTWAT